MADAVWPQGTGQSRGSRRGLILPGGGEASTGSCTRSLAPCFIPGWTPVLLLTEVRVSRGHQDAHDPKTTEHFGSTGFTPSSWGRQSPEATLKGAMQGRRHRALLCTSPSPCLLLAPTVPRATCTTGMSSPSIRKAGSHLHPPHHRDVPQNTSNCMPLAPGPPCQSPGCRHVSPAILSSPALCSPSNGTVYYYYCWLPTS